MLLPPFFVFMVLKIWSVIVEMAWEAVMSVIGWPPSTPRICTRFATAFASTSKMAPPSITSSTQSMQTSRFSKHVRASKVPPNKAVSASTSPSRTMFKMSSFSAADPTTYARASAPQRKTATLLSIKITSASPRATAAFFVFLKSFASKAFSSHCLACR